MAYRKSRPGGLTKGTVSQIPKGASPHIITDVLYPAHEGLLENHDADKIEIFTDSSASARAITAVNTIHHSGKAKKIGSTSIDINADYEGGTGDYLQVPDSTDWDFGTDPFTIEAWIYPTYVNGADAHNIYCHFQSTNSGEFRSFRLSSGNINWAGITTSGTLVVANSWQHIAVSRDSGTTKIFLNGVQLSSTSDSTDYGAITGDLFIGQRNSGQWFYGWIDELRVVKGTGVYTGAFTPPTALTTTGGTYAGSTTYVNTSFTAANTKLLIHSDNGGHVGDYGTEQADGRKYYYTDIKGSKPIKDPRIGAHFGGHRHVFSSGQILEQETAANGKNVYSIDGRSWCRFVDSGSNSFEITDSSMAHGIYFYAGGGTNPDFTSYVEFTGYFNAVNWTVVSNTDAQVNLSIDGKITRNFTGGQTSITSPLLNRFVGAGSVVSLEFSSTPTLGIHTVRIGTDAASKSLRAHGIELIVQDTTDTPSKSKIQIPSQKVVSYGKNFTVDAAAQHYDPFNGFTNSTSLHSAFVDTATSLGLSSAAGLSAKWAISDTNNIRPYNGGRVVKWVDSSGVIKTSVNMMPPNAQNVSATAAAEITTPSATNTLLPAFSNDAIYHSLAEVAKCFHYREFGNGSANQGTGGSTYADASMLNVYDDIAFVMDDGLTSLVAKNGVATASWGATQALGVNGSSNSESFLTFIGTGIGYHAPSAPTNYNSLNSHVVAQNLPYGTHVIRNGRNSGGTLNNVDVDGIEVYDDNAAVQGIEYIDIFQPKMPPIPEDAVVLADYMLMADFVPISTANLKYVSKGARFTALSRDVVVDRISGAATMTLSMNASNAMGFDLHGDEIKVRLPMFATNYAQRGYQSDTRTKLFRDASTDLDSSATKDNTASYGSYAHLTSNLTLGVHNLGFQGDGTNGNSNRIEIASPIHTSSHYQTFETPYLHELVGGDRNMEQTNLVVTGDGKTWDEVNRDTSYIGNVVLQANLNTQNTSASAMIFTEWRGRKHSDTYKHVICMNKDFAIAYDRAVCLKDGTYSIHAFSITSSTGAAGTIASIWVNGEVHTHGYNGTGSTSYPQSCSTACVSLERGDYVQMYGQWRGQSESGYWIERI